MTEMPNMVLIGAAGRNVGKTEFACGLIRGLAGAHAVIGIKVTTIRGQGPCPRGAAGCGVCGSLQGPYMVTEETDATLNKDTSRMLRAGASRVLWLRVRRESLEEGVRALLARVPPGTPVVCESNSVREVLKPGCFVVIRAANDPNFKDSCRRVAGLADRTIVFNGAGWNAQPSELVFDQGRWWWRMDATAVILAGGRSRRMGRDKSMLPFGGKPLILHIADQLRPHFRAMLVGANDTARYAFTGLTVVPDRIPDQGPLMGLASCLEAAPTEKVFLTGCDIPTMDTTTIRGMVAGLDNHDAVIAVTADGMRHPLFAAYRKSVLSAAEAALSVGKRRMEDLLSAVRAIVYPIPVNAWFRNLNTPEEYEAAAAGAALHGHGQAEP